MIKLVVPKCATEKEEAEWWDAHMDIVESNLIEAMRNGTAGRGTAKRLMQEARERERIALPNADLERAKKLSRRKKVDLQTYVSELVHKALDREEAAAKRARTAKKPA